MKNKTSLHNPSLTATKLAPGQTHRGTETTARHAIMMTYRICGILKGTLSVKEPGAKNQVIAARAPVTMTSRNGHKKGNGSVTRPIARKANTERKNIPHESDEWVPEEGMSLTITPSIRESS